MTHQVHKVTPRHDLTWYVKWISCVFVLVAVACRSVEEVPKIYDVVFSLVGTLGWLWVGYIWHDRALLMVNGVACAALAMGIMRHLFV